MQTNIERFNLVTAHILGRLYEEFPVACELLGHDIIRAMGDALEFPAGALEHERNSFAGYTLMWLQDTGYLIVRGEMPKRWVLAPKALELMNAMPSSLKGKEALAAEKSIGEQLTEFSKSTGKEVLSETRKQGIANLVGYVLGGFVRAHMGP